MFPGMLLIKPSFIRAPQIDADETQMAKRLQASRLEVQDSGICANPCSSVGKIYFKKNAGELLDPPALQSQNESVMNPIPSCPHTRSTRNGFQANQNFRSSSKSHYSLSSSRGVTQMGRRRGRRKSRCRHVLTSIRVNLCLSVAKIWLAEGVWLQRPFGFARLKSGLHLLG